jgi:hypothetical protein
LEVGLDEGQARSAITDLLICGLVTVGTDEEWACTVVNLVEAEGR